MKLLILAMSLAVMQATPPVPRKASNSNASTSQSVQSHADDKNTPPATPTPIPQATATPQADKKSTNAGATNTDNAVVIREPVPVSVIKDWADYLSIFSSFLLFIIGALGVGFAVKTLKAINKQAELMEGQLKEMQEAGKQTAQQLSLTERPWISPSAYIMSPLTADENGIHITLRIELSNVGNSPAVGIWIEPSIYLQHVSKPSVVDERKRICEQVIARSPTWGQVLFPKAQMPYMQDFTINATAEDVQKSRVGNGDVVTDMIAPEIILCVAYRSTVDEQAKHYTAMIYTLSKFDPQRPNSMFVFRAAESVPKDQVRLYGSIFGPIAE